MTLFIEDGAPVIVQGMTGHQGMTHTARMLKAGTNIVGGVNARKAGLDVTFPEAKNGEDATIHVFANCSEAIEATGAKASVVFVPSEHMTKPVVAYIAGFTAPEGKQMGHAGAIVSGGKGTAQDKKEALEAVGIRVGRTPGQTAEIMREVLASQSL